ncbi:MAG: ABC transporter permease, partial [Methanomassiliicoccaceae archaeon]|nr:ABC transporter permease [Methanomassiliicoccaceae archaeon]
MNHLWNLIRKELKELITPASIISIVVVALLFGTMGGMISSEVDRAEQLPTIGLIMADDTDHFETARSAINDYYKGYAGGIVPMTSAWNDRDAIIVEMNERGLSTTLVFGATYSKDIDAFVSGVKGANGGVIDIYWSEVRSGVFGAVSTIVISDLISKINTETAKSILGDSDIKNAGNVIAPLDTPTNCTVFNGKVYEGVTPSDISSALQSQSLLMPIFMMIIITMIGSMIISSMGNEKENKTLETLLTLPVRRTTVVGGKLIGSAVGGLIFGAIYLAGMYFYTKSVSGGAGLSLSDLGLTLSLFDWTIVAVVIFLAILSALGICMILGAFVKNYKAAQTLTLPISMLAMIPMFVTMFADFNTLPMVIQVLLFAIPVTHPMMIMN